MIKLAEGNGNINIAPEHIVSVRNGDAGYSQINTVSEVYFVKESPEEVTRKILEYKTQLIKFSAAHQTDSSDDIFDSYVYLKILAGLEVSHDPT